MTTEVGQLAFDQKNIIGHGSNGTNVFKGFYYKDPTILGSPASDDDNKKKVAIKRILRTYVNSDENIVNHEVELMLKVGHHPNILRYIHSEMDINYLCVYYLNLIND